MAASLAEIRPDYIFHLAGVTRAPSIREYYRVNLTYAVSLIGAMALARLERTPLLLVGTGAEYGRVEADQLPIDEGMLERPYDHYGASKLAQTAFGRVVAEEHPVVIVRPFNLIGPGMPAHLALASFASQIARATDQATIRTGSLLPSRDFVDVRDAVRAYWELLQVSAAYGQVVNVCSGHPVVIDQMLRRLIVISGKEVGVAISSDLQKRVDVPVHYGSNSRLNRLLGWAPQLDLDATLREVYSEAVQRGR